MKAPQIIYLVIVGMGLLISANKHGQENKYNFWTQLVASAIGMSLLIWGGFFK